MDKQTPSQSFRQISNWVGCLSVLLAVVLIVGLAAFFSYPEWKGPYRSITDVADLDGDGDLDVIVGHTRWETVDTSWAGVDLWINQGGGQFTPSDQELYGGFSAAAGDVDGDGDADLLILDGYALMLSLNQGGAQGGQVGVFETNNPIRPSVQWRGHADMGGSVILGDLNNDGAVDGFVASCCYGSGEDPYNPRSRIPSSVWVWINEWDPRGWLVRHSAILTDLDGLPLRATDLGDLDSDGDIDVFAAIGKPTLGTISSLADLVLLNDGSGNFTDSGQRLGETDSHSVALGDLDGDGDLDALVGAKGGSKVWINHGGAQGGQEGSFVPSDGEVSVGQTKAVFLSDFDEDSDLDALIAEPRKAVIWWNDGHATFTSSNQRFRYSERYGLAIGDFDGNRSPDIFGGKDTDAYHIWFNQGDGTFVQRGDG